MGFLHHHRLVELFKDPASQELSMSRTLMPWMFLLDAAWTYAAVKGWPPKESVAPVSSMLGIITGALCGIYGLNSLGGSISSVVSRWSGNIDGIPPRANPAPPERKPE